MQNRAGSRVGRHRRAAATLATAGITGAALVTAIAHAGVAQAGPDGALLPGNLLVSTSTYAGSANTVVVGQTLPPGCVTDCAVATSDGTYPEVWNNVLADESFGIASPVTLDQLTPSGRFVSALRVPDQPGGTDLVTSFSSKSEMALNLSTRGRSVTFMGYVAPVNGIDVSNANTPAVIDPTNPVPGITLRGVAQVDPQGQVRVTETNAYSGNNGRAAILNDSHGQGIYYTARSRPG
jgi:hypothetical protein